MSTINLLEKRQDEPFVFSEAQIINLDEILLLLDLDSNLIYKESLEEIIRLALLETNKFTLIEIEEIMLEVQGATNAGMNGEVTLEDTIAARLEIAAKYEAIVTQEHIDRVAKMCEEEIIEDVPKMIQDLRKKYSDKIKLLIVSGGPIECVLAVARKLGIDHESCAGNKIVIDENGLLNRQDSEINSSKIMPAFEAIGGNPNPDNIVAIGDGKTDLDLWLKEMARYFILNLSVISRNERASLLQKQYLEDPTFAFKDNISEIHSQLEMIIEEILSGKCQFEVAA